jgi:hypothetical protein
MAGPYSQIFEARIYTSLTVAEYDKVTALRLSLGLQTKAAIKNHLRMFRVEELLEAKKYCIDFNCINDPDSVLENKETKSQNIPEFMEHFEECLLMSGVSRGQILMIIFFIGPNQSTIQLSHNKWVHI